MTFFKRLKRKLLKRSTALARIQRKAPIRGRSLNFGNALPNRTPTSLSRPLSSMNSSIDETARKAGSWSVIVCLDQSRNYASLFVAKKIECYPGPVLLLFFFFSLKAKLKFVRFYAGYYSQATVTAKIS